MDCIELLCKVEESAGLKAEKNTNEYDEWWCFYYAYYKSLRGF